MMKHKLFFLLFAGLTLPAAADTLHFTGVGGNQSDGVYTYPYNFTATLGGGAPTSMSLMCVDFNREITFDESWVVNETDIPRDNSDVSKQLRALAVIDWEMLHPTVGNSSNDYQFAAWSIFNPSGVAGKNGMTAAAQTISAKAILAGDGLGPLPVNFSFAQIVLFSPTTDETGWTHDAPQRFIGLATPEFRTNHLAPSPTPEPSSLMLLGTGIFGVAGMMYRRVRSAVAGI